MTVSITAIRVAGTCTLAAIACIGLQAETGTTDAAGNWGAITHCATQEKASARHACMDEVLRNAGLLDPARDVAEQREEFGRTARSEKPKPSAAPTPASNAPADIDQIEAKIAYAKLGGNGRLLVVTDDGAVWRQTSNETIHFAPKAGASFSVSKVSLGGYRCKAGSTAYRCERLD